MTKEGLELAVRYMLHEVMQTVEKRDVPPPDTSTAFGEGPMEFTDPNTGETLWGMVRVCIAPDRERLIKLAERSTMFK